MTATLDKIDALAEAATIGPSGAPAASGRASHSEKKAAKRQVRFWRLVDWRMIVGALLLAGLVHIGLVLATPFRLDTSALQRLRTELPVNRAVIVSAPVPGRQPVAFMLPDAAYALCRYDISVDSLRISTALLDQGWVLSLHTAAGDNYYVTPGQARRTDVSFVIMPGAGSLEAGPVPRRFGTSGEVQIPSPTLEGVVMVRAPYKGIAFRSQTEAALAQTVCAPVKR